ncbi:hypothetical protein RF679_04075 [Undibacterium cyanobacteriorum]|uniref:Uncharacterized protein n=1 Tax=Undibacterium cyanobacteriorum TaxID=3073561 RepID=A0ABY9RKU1_9BURK|nr:hypothetical protein [Undibacterium sp. 20NA77.5]WMW81463.1 hypothetical protein RF679_04075 [Undibacterium sp. 20NA77.5]
MHTFDSPPYSTPLSWRTQQGGQRIVMLMILLLHLMLGWTLLDWHPISAPNEPNSRLLIQWFNPEQTTLPNPSSVVQASPTSAQNRTQVRKGISINKSAQTPSRLQTKEATLPSDSPKAIEQEKPNRDDPFASPAPTAPATTSKQANQIEQWRSEVNKSYKQVESEQPIKRWLMNKKELTPMEKFARDALGATPAREIQTAEEMRPDGSRMTRVKTPRGEFCVVGQPPGRPYEARMPDQRIMQCPIYF